ncbi:MAG: hypothetical protein ACYC8S_01800 [Minisyncoccota bacterium]
MKPWQINSIAILFILLVAIFLPPSLAKAIVALSVIISCIWAYFDAKKLDISKYQTKGFLVPGGSPGAVASVMFLLWIVGFPLYVSYRQKIINGEVPLKISGAPTQP